MVMEKTPSHTLSVIIPVFNESATIGKIIEKVAAIPLPGIKKEIIIVDDASTDGTQEIISQWNNQYTILRHRKNCGKGAAIKTALSYVHGDYVIIQDADLEYDPGDWQLMLAALKTDANCAVYGSRNLRPEKRGYLPFYLGGVLLTRIINLFFKTNLTDINTGYKLFPANLLKSLNLKSGGFQFCEEVTVKLLKRDITIKEVPIGYQPRTFKEGKKISVLDGLIGLWAIFRYSLFS